MAKIILSAQNFAIYDQDGLDPYARTGSVSADHLVKAGASGVILGHSETGDTPEVVRQKILTIANKSVLPHTTLLIGESWDEFENSSHDQVAEIICDRMQEILEGISDDFRSGLVIGYEPKWGSRGSGRDDMPPPSPELVSVVCKKMRSVLAQDVPVIYGGRSTPERTIEILSSPDVEGLILGSACNTVRKTMDIAEAMIKARPSRRKVLHANFKAFDLPDSYEAYIEAFNALDDDFIIYISPAHTDIREVARLLKS